MPVEQSPIEIHISAEGNVIELRRYDSRRDYWSWSSAWCLPRADHARAIECAKEWQREYTSTNGQAIPPIFDHWNE
jgi:hypothetical protein